MLNNNFAIQRIVVHYRPNPTAIVLSKSRSFGSSFHSRYLKKMTQKSEQEWRAVLTPEQFRVLREKGTERPGTGEFNKHFESGNSIACFFSNILGLKLFELLGVYTCAGCKAPLYTSKTKFDSGCGWPAFFDAIPGAVSRHIDNSFGMERIEITCTACGGHLGHVFKGEAITAKYDTHERQCVNSISLSFKGEK